MDETTEDTVLDGRVRLRQPARGYRAGLDAALLAAACDAGPGQRVLEAGCGVGGALLAGATRRARATPPGVGRGAALRAAATRRADAPFVGVERDAKAAALAQQNAGLNGLDARVSVIQADL